MSGEDMASSYSFGEFDDFSEFDIQGENDETGSVDLYAGSGIIPKSNILILSDIEESFVVLGRDILKSIKYYSRDEHPDSEDFEIDATPFSSKETIIEKGDKFGITLKNNKKTLSNLKDVTERFRSASSPLPCDSNTVSPSNEAFFNSTAKNHCKNTDSDTDVDKILKEITQSLRPTMKINSKKQNQKCRMKDNFDNMTILEGKVTSITDQISRLKYHELKDVARNETNDFESRNLQLPSEIKLKDVSETLNDNSEKLSASSLMRNISECSNLDNYESSETVKIRDLKKVIDESLLDVSNADQRTKKLLHNLKNSIEIYENSNCNVDSRSRNAKRESASNVDEQSISREYKGLTNKIARTLNYAIAINFLLFIVFMVFVYFWGVIVIDMLKMSDILIKTTSKIESLQRWPFL